MGARSAATVRTSTSTLSQAAGGGLRQTAYGGRVGTATTAMARPRRPRAWQTKAAALGASAVSAYLGYLFVTSLLVGLGVTDVPDRGLSNPVFDGAGLGDDDVRHAEQYLSVTFGLCLAASTPVAVGLWLRRPWAREAAYGIFGLPGFVLVLLTFSGLASSSRARSGVWGALVAVSLLVVTGLAASPGCGRDVERVAKDREIAARDAQRARRAA